MVVVGAGTASRQALARSPRSTKDLVLGSTGVADRSAPFPVITTALQVSISVSSQRAARIKVLVVAPESALVAPTGPLPVEHPSYNRTN